MKLNIKYNFLTLLLLSVTLPLYSQDAKTTLQVDKRFHDFGKIKEDGGKVRAVFTFKNTGSSELIIQNVESSCGCTIENGLKVQLLREIQELLQEFMTLKI